MKLNSLTVCFFVMNNIFYSKDENDDNLVIHEKYDIKVGVVSPFCCWLYFLFSGQGSTVNRSSAPPVEGQVCVCKNCEQKFVYTRGKRKFLGAARARASTLGLVNPNPHSGSISSSRYIPSSAQPPAPGTNNAASSHASLSRYFSYSSPFSSSDSNGHSHAFRYLPASEDFVNQYT